MPGKRCVLPIYLLLQNTSGNKRLNHIQLYITMGIVFLRWRTFVVAALCDGGPESTKVPKLFHVHGHFIDYACIHHYLSFEMLLA